MRNGDVVVLIWQSCTFKFTRANRCPTASDLRLAKNQITFRPSFPSGLLISAQRLYGEYREAPRRGPCTALHTKNLAFAFYTMSMFPNARNVLITGNSTLTNHVVDRILAEESLDEGMIKVAFSKCWISMTSPRHQNPTSTCG